MASSRKTAVKVVLGVMSFGQKHVAPACRVTDIETGNSMLDVFQKHGHTEIDTARRYGNGTSETMLGTLKCQKRGLLIGTKYLSALYMNPETAIPEGWDFDRRYHPDMLRLSLQKSLEELRMQKVHVYYLGPDRSVSQKRIFRGVDAIHREGLFAQLGLDSLTAGEVAQICELCDRKGWVKPSVYQGRYNALHRVVEPELFPCLRRYGIKFYAVNPMRSFLASGAWHLRNNREGYRHDKYFAAIELLDPVIEKYGLTLRECTLRWLAHHSLLDGEKGDAVLVGGSNVAHLESNLANLEKAPLPDEVVEALNRGYERVGG